MFGFTNVGVNISTTHDTIIRVIVFPRHDRTCYKKISASFYFHLGTTVIQILVLTFK